ncbi:MAG: OmpA/MotB domain protein [Ignavibacteria bacterium]|nr:OmpA/MotB domain protein [Ignavibacteria bacterium]
MKMKIKIVELLVFILLGNYNSFAQSGPERVYSLGLYSNFSFNFHGGDFKLVPGLSQAPSSYQTGYGTGSQFGASFDYAISPKLSGLLQIGYVTFDGELIAEGKEQIFVTSFVKDGKYENQLKANFDGITTQFGIGYEVMKNMQLFFKLDITSLQNASYKQKEVVSWPVNNGTFRDSIDGSNTQKSIRKDTSGTLPGLSSTVISPIIGIAYSFPLSKRGTFSITPSFSFMPGISDLVNNANWTNYGLFFGLTVHYNNIKGEPFPEDEEPAIEPVKPPEVKSQPKKEEPPPPPTKPVAKPETKPIPKTIKKTEPKVTMPEISYNLIDTINKNQSDRIIKIWNDNALYYEPILNYIFFDSASAELPARYISYDKSYRNTFKLNSPCGDYSNCYYQILNIIGARMNQFPKSMISLNALYLNDDSTDAKAIAILRNQIVSNYLKSVWDINEKRILTNTEKVKKLTSKTNEIALNQELQRVEIKTNQNDLFYPLLRSNNPEKKMLTNFTNLRINIGELKDSINNNTKLRILHDNTKLKEISSTLNTREYNIDYNDIIGSDFAASDTLGIVYEIIDKNKNVYSRQVNIPVEVDTTIQKTNKTSKEQFKLIQFEYNKADISTNQQWLLIWVKNKIRTNSKISIFGYTDNLGSERYNQKLSVERAKSTERILGIHPHKVAGLGNYNNSIESVYPEHRFYARSADIIIETPKK